MPDWTSSMIQTFEFYKVDARTWENKALLNNVTACSITRDLSADTLGSASISIDDYQGEGYIRVYLVTNQNNTEEKFPLGTFLIQSPSKKFDGKKTEASIDAYTPLIELQETLPPIGYYVPKKENVMEWVNFIVADHLRAPVVEGDSDHTLKENFVADPSEKWLSFAKDLVMKANRYIDLDEEGRVIFSVIKDAKAMRPTWTYNTSNSSILFPSISMGHDIYNVPNVYQVITPEGKTITAKNEEDGSPLSIKSRGRQIVMRESNPYLPGNPSDEEYKDYAQRKLKELSTVEYTITYKHGYCPVNIGDCVMIDYPQAGINMQKAKVISQSIECIPGCPVTETAIYTATLWGEEE